MFKKHLDYHPARKLSPWRKISIGSWRPTGDSSIYTTLEIRVDALLPLLEKNKISLSTFIVHALARAISASPEINAMIRFGRIYPRKTVDVFFHIIADSMGEDLDGMLFQNADKRQLSDLEQDFRSNVRDRKQHQKSPYDQSKIIFQYLPAFFSKWVLDLLHFVKFQLNLWSPLMGTPQNPFGSIMVTNIGSFGAEEAFCPIAPYTGIPMVVALGSVKKRPWIEDDQIIIAKTMKLCFTYDHRLMDGVHFKRLRVQFMREIQRYLENPA